MKNPFGDRLAYNFNAYQHRFYRRVLMIENRPDPERQPKRTIEFRQAAGTVDPEEIVAHAKIVVRLCEYASVTTTEELWKTIGDLAVGEAHNDWYDVFDFLVDLNLEAEARVIERHMAKERGIEILDQERGLARYPKKASDSGSLLSAVGKLFSRGSSDRSSLRSPSPISQGSPRGSPQRWSPGNSED
ncbi:hypothetical protein F5B19DRAFT_476860 [Rostrohypoxylon terebratum]|nr:hypothetical protein F5B19DRAFT_476860 [Rostrohypoxylon terebratum]